MRNKIINNYKNNTIFGSILMIGLLILLAGFSYAFFVYNKTGLYTHTITGGKMSIIYNETTGNNITIDNAYPLIDEEAITKGLEFEFTITGYNESDKNIYYAIEMDYGEDVENKDRLLDSDMKLTLYENEEIIFENEIFNNLDNHDIHYGMIDSGTSSESPVTNNYKLRIWINDYVIISDTISNDLSTWNDFEWDFLENYNKNVYDLLMNSDSQNLSDYGISIYTTEEFQNMYANFKVNVKADLTYDDVGFLTYDANGGEFTPTKTSLTTGRITTQKPVMRTEITSQTNNNLNGKMSQIDNEVEYEYKGFLGWSSTPNGEVEYRAGDYYSGNGKILYAIYGNTVNKMVEYWPDELNELKANITNVYFINDIQTNIDNNYNNAEYKWDLSYDGSGNVKSWIEIDETNSIATLYIGSEGTIYLTNCYSLFADWYSLSDISFDNVDTSMVTDMSYMFSNNFDNDSGSEEISFKNNDLNEAKLQPIVGCNTVYLPYNQLTYLDLTSFNTTNVTNMSNMFGVIYDGDGCGTLTETKIEYIDLSSFDLSNVLDMSCMFNGQGSLNLIKLPNSTVNKVKNMSYMFRYCTALTSLNFKDFDTSQVTNMSSMFSECINLTTIDISNFNTEKVTDMSYMFYRCSGLTIIDVNNFNTTNVTDMSYMFYRCSGLAIIDVNNFNTTNVTDMSYMFYRCSGLSIIDVNNFNTTSVTNMSGMFSHCSGLTTIDFSSFNTGNVTNMSGMFLQCSGLTTINFSSFNTTNVTDMSYMFSWCSSLTNIDVSSFNTTNVTDMSCMFNCCSSLTNINVSSFNTNKVTDMTSMFSECTSLKKIDLSNFEATSIYEFGSVFDGCSNIVSINLKNFNAVSGNYFLFAFRGCSKLERIYCNYNWKSSSNSSQNIFSGCTSLVGAISYSYMPMSNELSFANPDTGYFTYKTA